MDIAATPWFTVFVGRRNKPSKPGFCFTLHSEQHLVNRGLPVNPYLSFDQLIMLTIRVSELRVYKEDDTTWPRYNNTWSRLDARQFTSIST